MELESLRCALCCVAVHRNMMETELMRNYLTLLEQVRRGDASGAADCYTWIYHTLRAGGYTGPGAWLFDRLRYEVSPYSALVERGEEDAALAEAAQEEIGTFALLAGLDCNALIGRMAEGASPPLAAAMEKLPAWNTDVPFTFDSLTAFYRENGVGLFARSRAFLWQDGALMPIDSPDCPGEEELLGYALQREQVVENTRALLAGRAVNNVLLYGDTGTGKSATVKYLLRVPGFESLRLIEVQKTELGGLPQIIRTLRGSRHKFILFIDDLAFDQDDRTYSILKTVLEGGLEPRPTNVAVYATSNRRHLVRQTFSDRLGDEVDAVETVQEKTSLSDRFGVRIAYLALNKAEYLDMVEYLAKRAGITLTRESLRAQAVKWDMHHPGRTPRTAKQFIASLRR